VCGEIAWSQQKVPVLYGAKPGGAGAGGGTGGVGGGGSGITANEPMASFHIWPSTTPRVCSRAAVSSATT